MWSPIQDDTEIKATYERLLTPDKPKKIALVAARRQTLWGQLTLFLRDTFLPDAPPV